jgi:iron(III) transport system substrate-binding protein
MRLFLPIMIVLSFVLSGCISTQNELILYTSLDQIYSEPITKEFEKTSGITVKVVYDSEATKTVGLVNRLLAEKNNPQADVFWNSEVGRTIVLKNKGVLAPYISPQSKGIPGYFKDPEGYWTGFAARARVLIYNTNLVKESDLPKQLEDLTQPRWKDKVVIANPLFGSTATQIAALHTIWGGEKTTQFLKALKSNGVVLVDGNSLVRDKVGAGSFPVGLTDTDDANSGILGGMPVKMAFLDQGEGEIGTFVMPNTVCLIKNGPHRKNAEKLIDYLLSPDVERKLAACPSVQIPLHQGLKLDSGLAIDQIRVMPVDFVTVGNTLETSSRILQELFAR